MARLFVIVDKDGKKEVLSSSYFSISQEEIMPGSYYKENPGGATVLVDQADPEAFRVVYEFSNGTREFIEALMVLNIFKTESALSELLNYQ